MSRTFELVTLLSLEWSPSHPLNCRVLARSFRCRYNGECMKQHSPAPPPWFPTKALLDNRHRKWELGRFLVWHLHTTKIWPPFGSDLGIVFGNGRNAIIMLLLLSYREKRCSHAPQCIKWTTLTFSVKINRRYIFRVQLLHWTLDTSHPNAFLACRTDWEIRSSFLMHWPSHSGSLKGSLFKQTFPS